MGSQEGAEKKQEALPRSRLLALGGEGNSELFGGGPVPSGSQSLAQSFACEIS